MPYTISLLISLLLLCGSAFAQSEDQEEPAAILEVGGAPAWSLTEAGSSFGPTIAVEFTPVERWLEIETGVTPGFSRDSREWDVDILFKKPWSLSNKIEFMAGAGPVWMNTKRSGVTANSIGGEVALDFMFWTSAKHRFGWYVEPGYEYNFGRGHERSLGMSIGLLIGIR